MNSSGMHLLTMSRFCEQAMGNIHGILPEGKVVTGVEVRAIALRGSTSSC